MPLRWKNSYEKYRLDRNAGLREINFGQIVGAASEASFYDADNVLEKLEGKTIKELFAVSEACFRDAETRAVRHLSELEGCVIAAGGGVVKRSENIEVLKNGGIIVFIDRLPEKNCTGHRYRKPPFISSRAAESFDLYAERIELYRRYHDHIIDNNGEREAALQALLELARRES